MANSISGMPQTSTSLPYNNSTNSNNTAPTAYITELFDLHKHGICHTPNGRCLPNCIAYKASFIKHTDSGGLGFFEPYDIGMKYPPYFIVAPNALPEKVVLQKNKNSVFRHVKHYFHKINRNIIVLKDYAAREQLFSNERARIIKKLENNIAIYNDNISSCYSRKLTINSAYAIHYSETQIRLLRLQEQNPEKEAQNSNSRNN